MKSVIIYLGLGSNMGDREANLCRALELLSKKVKVNKVSPVYDTAPVGFINQSRFFNLVCKGQTLLSPCDLLNYTKSVEKQMGRLTGPRNSPRPIDIDILFYNGVVMETPELIIPHARLQERAFVLAPLVDIAPKLVHPVSRKTASRLLKELTRTEGDAVCTNIKVREQI